MSASQQVESIAASTPEAQAWQRSAADWEWLRTRPEVLAEHAGRWICVVDQRVVVSEAEHDAFYREVRRGGYLPQSPLIMRVPPLSEWQDPRVR